MPSQPKNIRREPIFARGIFLRNAEVFVRCISFGRYFRETLLRRSCRLVSSLRILREEAPDVEITLMTKSSPELADGLMQGKIDVAPLRREAHTAGLDFKFLTKEPLIARLPTRHRLARHQAVRPQDLARESFISTARVAPVLRTVIDDYTAEEGITLKQNYDAETLSGGMSLVASTGGFTLLPLYVRNALIPSVVARPLRGEVPAIGLMMGYNKSNTSPLLKRFLLRADELVNRVSQGEAHSRTLKRADRKPSV
ncbi:MAG TPA: LysR substrate-binding domain-containing protein [Candidatus Limnocylindrales bacterium]|nr:LysR substrate-binding domain-containing protein [Candidatus Limnocylindrales bacterium]